MKKFMTSLQKEYDRFSEHFSKKDIKESFDILVKNGFLIQVNDTDQYELNYNKILKMETEYNEWLKEQNN